MIDTKGLDEFRKAWDEAKESKEPKAADTGAVTDVDDFDYGDPVKDTAKADEIKAAPVVESKADDSDKSPVQTTPAVEPAKLSFKEAFAKEYKRYKADPNSASTFDWNGKKYALKLASEVKKPTQATEAAPIVKPESKPEAKQDDHTAAWNDDGSSDKKEMARLTNQPQASRTKSMVDALVPDSWIPPAFKNNGESETKVANVASPPKTNSPMRSTPDVKAADSHKAITDKMGVDSKTLLPKPETRIAAAGKGNRVQ